MRLVSYLSGLVLVVVIATWAYRVNYATQDALGRVADLRAEIAREREAIQVLEAEWAFLNRPERLRALLETHGQALGLEPIRPDQFGSARMVAYPAPPEPDAEPDADHHDDDARDD